MSDTQEQQRFIIIDGYEPFDAGWTENGQPTVEDMDFTILLEIWKSLQFQARKATYYWVDDDTVVLAYIVNNSITIEHVLREGGEWVLPNEGWHGLSWKVILPGERIEELYAEFLTQEKDVMDRCIHLPLAVTARKLIVLLAEEAAVSL